MGWGGLSQWSTSWSAGLEPHLLSVCDINLCIGSAGIYAKNYCPMCSFLKLEILCQKLIEKVLE